MLNDLMLEKNCVRWIIELCSYSIFTSIVLSCNLTQKCDYFRMLLHTNSSIKDKEYNYYKHHEKSTCLVFHAEREDMKRKVMDETCFCWKCCWGWRYKVFTGQWVQTCRRRAERFIKQTRNKTAITTHLELSPLPLTLPLMMKMLTAMLNAAKRKD